MLRGGAYPFVIVDNASPLGPGWNEAIDLTCQKIIPEPGTAPRRRAMTPNGRSKGKDPDYTALR